VPSNEAVLLSDTGQADPVDPVPVAVAVQVSVVPEIAACAVPVA
jgi:hypothetical protein